MFFTSGDKILIKKPPFDFIMTFRFILVELPWMPVSCMRQLVRDSQRLSQTILLPCQLQEKFGDNPSIAGACDRPRKVAVLLYYMKGSPLTGFSNAIFAQHSCSDDFVLLFDVIIWPYAEIPRFSWKHWMASVILWERLRENKTKQKKIMHALAVP